MDSNQLELVDQILAGLPEGASVTVILGVDGSYNLLYCLRGDMRLERLDKESGEAFLEMYPDLLTILHTLPLAVLATRRRVLLIDELLQVL